MAEKIRENQFDEVGVNPFNAPIPGESLTTAPDMPRAWERPPQYTSQDKAMEAIYMEITQEDSLRKLINIINDGIPLDEIAQAVEVKVNNMLRDFIQESGVGENAQALEFTESVSKQVSSQALTGSKIIKTEVAKDGTFYVLVEYALQNAVDASVSEARNQEALYNEFKARQGFEALEKELNSLNTGP